MSDGVAVKSLRCSKIIPESPRTTWFFSTCGRSCFISATISRSFSHRCPRKGRRLPAPAQAVRGKGDLPFLSHHRDEHAPFRPGRHLFAGRAVFTWDLPLRERDESRVPWEKSQTDQFSLTTMKSFSQRSVPSALLLFSSCANILSVLPASPSG